METLYQILGLMGGGLILFLLYRAIKGRPDQFSKENLNKKGKKKDFILLAEEIIKF